ncbi:SPOR domain-containing protein [Xylophilus sp. GOD-11R]|uniref:SPOR domain-containing protein n=1 Tax=Xylophilus sp. GOD-11R TaxID=3089814 RepID=UPI00298CBC4F|nr:SPOR domain-containing protein [Xylophilus sp. GOD-11R]WPB55981.1 SPOR domain-containing protein [Xylophilus sp. GOD-11R]
MALFNLRWPGRAPQDDGKRGARQRRAVSTESVDALRRRARHRLIGAAVMLVAGVVGFPLLFDTQQRPIPVDIPIAIPSQGPVASAPSVPAASPAAPAAAPSSTPAPAASQAASSASSRPSAAESLDRGEEIVARSAPEFEKKPAATTPIPLRPPTKTTEQKPETHREPVVTAKPVTPAAVARDDDAARARALLEGKPTAAPAAAATVATAPSTPPAGAEAGRFVVQVGAFGDAAKAQEARAKLTRGGLKTYVQSVDTKDGKRIRVRVGPFANKAEADRAAARVKGLDLPASILTL